MSYVEKYITVISVCVCDKLSQILWPNEETGKTYSGLTLPDILTEKPLFLDLTVLQGVKYITVFSVCVCVYEPCIKYDNIFYYF